jgi:hypothetical protein
MRSTHPGHLTSARLRHGYTPVRGPHDRGSGGDRCGVGLPPWPSAGVGSAFRALALTALLACCLSCRGAALEGLVAAWDFDAGQGDTLQDRVGSAHGIIHGAAWVAVGTGYALRFDGVDDWVEFGNPPALSPATAMTLEAWVMPEKVPTAGEPGIVGKGFQNFVLTYYQDGKCWWYTGQSGTNAKGAVSPGFWHHVVGTYDGQALALYVDGDAVDRRPAQTGPIPSGANFYMGKSDGDVQYTKNAHFGGLLDDVCVYSRALSAAEVRQRYLTTHLTGAPEVTAFAHVGSRQVVAQVSVRGLGELAPGASATMALRAAGKRRPLVVRTVAPLPPGGTFDTALQTERLEPGEYVVRATVTDAAGQALGRPAEATLTWPSAPTWGVKDRRIKVLNSLVSELRNVERVGGAGKRVDFTNPRPGWVFFQAVPGAGDKGTITLTLPEVPGAETRLEVKPGAPDPVEAMRCLPAGKHVVSVECAGGARLARLVIRAIPEIGYCRVDSGPQIKAYGPCDWDYLARYVLPHINLAVSHGAESEAAHWEQWRRQGKRWIVETPLPGIGKTDGVSADEVERGWIANGHLDEPRLDGIIVDEFSAGDDPIWGAWHEALRRLRDNPKYAGKVYYPYCGPLFGAAASRAFAQTVMDAGWAIALERYLSEEPTEAAARAALDVYVVRPVREWEAAQPGIVRHLLVVWGFFLSAPIESTNINPAIDFNAFMDMQMNTLANDPLFFGLYGVTSYLSGYADEETLRWYGRLVRHYCIEGGTARLTESYVLRHIANPDFAEGLTGWTAQAAEPGGIGSGSADGLSWLEGRYPATPLGNTYALLRRSAKAPNILRQKVSGLTPGRLYSAKMISGDRQEYERGASTPGEHAVHLRIADADILPEKTFRYSFGSCYAHTFGKFDSKNPYYMTLHQVVFRARSPQAELSITDWAGSDAPGGPVGQELMCNFVEVQPYVE